MQYHKVIQTLINFTHDHKNKKTLTQNDEDEFREIIQYIQNYAPKYSERKIKDSSGMSPKYKGEISHAWVEHIGEFFDKANAEKLTVCREILEETLKDSSEQGKEIESLEYMIFLCDWFDQDNINKCDLHPIIDQLSEKYYTNKFIKWHDTYIKYICTNKKNHQYFILLFRLWDLTAYSPIYPQEAAQLKLQIKNSTFEYLNNLIYEEKFIESEKAVSEIEEKFGMCSKTISAKSEIAISQARKMIKADLSSEVDRRVNEKILDIDKKFDELKNKNTEMLGVFSAVIAFIVTAATQLGGANANKDIAVPVLITIGLILVLFISTISLFNDRPKKDELFKDFRSWILIAYLLFVAALAVFTKVFFM